MRICAKEQIGRISPSRGGNGEENALQQLADRTLRRRSLSNLLLDPALRLPFLLPLDEPRRSLDCRRRRSPLLLLFLLHCLSHGRKSLRDERRCGRVHRSGDPLVSLLDCLLVLLHLDDSRLPLDPAEVLLRLPLGHVPPFLDEVRRLSWVRRSRRDSRRERSGDEPRVRENLAKGGTLGRIRTKDPGDEVDGLFREGVVGGEGVGVIADFAARERGKNGLGEEKGIERTGKCS